MEAQMANEQISLRSAITRLERTAATSSVLVGLVYDIRAHLSGDEPTAAEKEGNPPIMGAVSQLHSVIDQIDRNFQRMERLLQRANSALGIAPPSALNEANAYPQMAGAIRR